MRIFLTRSFAWTVFCCLLHGISGCSTALVNVNTLDMASTVDDIATRQIIFNLTKIKINEHALPTQVQITGGSVVAKTSVTPTLTTPLSSALTTTNQLQKAVAPTGTTNTSLNSGVALSPNIGLNVAGLAENDNTWTIVSVQEPGQIRRLRYLYEYATGHITARELVCRYEVPEKAEKATTADPLSPDKKPNSVKPSPPAPSKKITYLRSGCRGYFATFEKQRPNVPDGDRFLYQKLGKNPDPAFLALPGCVICAIPFGQPPKVLAQSYTGNLNTGIDIGKKKLGYSEGKYSDEVTPFPDQSDKRDFQQIVLKLEIAPYCDKTDFDYKEKKTTECANGKDDDKVDWLSIVPFGSPAPSGNVKRVGGANGQDVYIHLDRDGSNKFSEFMLAITEATLVANDKDKVSPQPPTFVVLP